MTKRTGGLLDRQQDPAGPPTGAGERRQTWRMTSIQVQWQRPVRVTIRRDTYDLQSYALAEVWTPNGWVEIHHLHQPAILDVGRYSDELPAKAAADEAALLTVTDKILGTGQWSAERSQR